MKAIWLVAMMLFLATTSANAQYSGVDMFNDCEGSGKNQVTDVTCSVYFIGFFESFLAVTGLKLERLGICVPRTVSANQVRLVTEKYMRDHPEKLDRAAAYVVLDAMGAAFPCKP